MAGTGPAPKPDGARRRRNATVAMTQLPAEGRQGEPPPWPLIVDPDEALTARERALWAELWATPQAVQWERQRWTADVALYVRWTVRAEQGSITAGTEARMLSDRLGLNPLAMLRLRWEVVEDELAARRPTGPRAAASPRAAAVRAAGVRRRVKAVET